MSAQPSPADAGMTLVEHLTELRKRLIICVVAVAIGMIVGFIAYEWVFDFLLKPYADVIRQQPSSGAIGDKLLLTDPLEGFGVRMKTSTYAGIAFAMPVILWQIWKFVTPGLYDHEKRYAVPFVISALALFVLGAGLAYYTLPRALDFLVDIGGDNLVTAFSPGKYFQLITYMMLAFGIGFEFPIVLIFLQMAGILETDTLRRGRRYAIVGICVLVAVITPSGDPISMLMLSVPMVIFDEGASVLVAAPTGSGKTVVAEHAVARALAEGAKAFYTTPIKALSNQKFADLARRHGAHNVGLLTGDNSINGDAPVVVMTTEVLRNMIYAGSSTLAGLRFVVLDEVHYLQDTYRGPVWEEVIIHLPESVSLVCLSATVSNAEEVADWLTTVRGTTR